MFAAVLRVIRRVASYPAQLMLFLLYSKDDGRIRAMLEAELSDGMLSEKEPTENAATQYLYPPTYQMATSKKDGNSSCSENESDKDEQLETDLEKGESADTAADRPLLFLR